MTDVFNVIGTLALILLFTSGNVERSIWLFLNTADTLRALKVVRANGRVIGVRTRRKSLRQALVCWISFIVAQPVSWLADRVFGWFPFYRSIKTLAILACAYWRLESSALFYQLVAVPLMKRHERQIDLTLSLLHATFGVLYHLTVELPRAFILAAWRPLLLWPLHKTSSPGISGGIRSPSRKEGDSRHSLATGDGPRPRRVSPSSNTSKLPEWPPPKRSVFSGDSSVTRNVGATRSSKHVPSLARTTTKALPIDVPAPKRRTVSATARAVSGSDAPRGREHEPRHGLAGGNAVAKTAAKLKSLPRPPSGDLNDSSGSDPGVTQPHPRKQAQSVTKTRQEHGGVSLRKRSRDEDDALALKRHTSRNSDPAPSKEEQVARRPAVKRKAAPAAEVRRSSGATARSKGKATSTAAGKRRRDVDTEGAATLPKRARSTRSTTGKRTTSTQKL